MCLLFWNCEQWILTKNNHTLDLVNIL